MPDYNYDDLSRDALQATAICEKPPAETHKIFHDATNASRQRI